MPFLRCTVSGILPIAIAATLICTACKEATPPTTTTVAAKDTSINQPLQQDSSAIPQDTSAMTAYTCAIRSLRAMEQHNLTALIPFVHPVKGLTLTHVNENIPKHQQPFSVAELQTADQQKMLFTVFSGYEQEVRRQSTLADLLQYYASSTTLQDDSLPGKFFSTSKDIRRNYKGNGTYILQPPLAPGQTTISYHFSDSTNEMNWQELVLRTETYQGKDYLVEVLRAYWTP